MAATTSSRGTTILRIRVHLVDSEPEIWRLLEVDAGLRLDQLHQVLQRVMGWQDKHLHAFGMVNPDVSAEPLSWGPRHLLDDDPHALLENQFTIRQVLAEQPGPLYYEYDFGDGWIHRIDLIESIAMTPADPPVRLIRGERRGPLEDSGGIDGYQELLRVLADPSHGDHADSMEWVGDGFDPAKFDSGAVERRLRGLFRAKKATAPAKKAPPTAAPLSPADRAKRDLFAAAGVRHVPGMAERMLREMAPLLAEEGIDVDQPSTFTTETLNAALARATERANLERFTPIGEPREYALTLIRLVCDAVSSGENELAAAVMASVEPEPESPRVASVAAVIGVGLGLLDGWHTDAALAGALANARVPDWNKRARAAATDILGLARKGRSFDAIGSLHLRHSGLAIFEGTLLAATASLVAWASRENQSVKEIGIRAVV